MSEVNFILSEDSSNIEYSESTLMIMLEKEKKKNNMHKKNRPKLYLESDLVQAVH